MVRASPPPRILSATRPLRPTLILAAAIGILTLLVFLRAVTNGFVEYDDPLYITHNAKVQAGLRLATVRWALTNFDGVFWHPLTWLSHALDCQLFGLNPAGHHLISVLLHAANAVMLFCFLAPATGRTGTSAFATLAWALHPLRVEAVAWAADRKDVLCALFVLALLLLYRRYALKPTLGGYATVFIAFVLAISAKPMAVTVPAVLVLLDFWPLQRLINTHRRRILLEKLPLLGGCVAAVAITLVGRHQESTALAPIALPVADRVLNAFAALGIYVRQTLAPIGLSVVYPPTPPGRLVGWIVVGVALAAGVPLLGIAQSRKRPYVLVGWLWFVGMLFPVLGVLPIGSYSLLADRYTYLPSIGLTILVAWLQTDFVASAPHLGRLLPAGAAAMLALLAAISWVQIGVWRDDGTLFTHALSVTKDNWQADAHVAAVAAASGDDVRAKSLYADAIRLHPFNPDVHYNWGNLLLREGDVAAAELHYRQAVSQAPAHARAHHNLAVVLAGSGRSDEALSEFKQAARLAPSDLGFRRSLAAMLARTRRGVPPSP